MPNFSVTNCEGRTVHYGGATEFEGSPRNVFWGGFFEPCFLKVITEQIDETVLDCHASDDLLDEALDETANLLCAFIERAYERMADIDQRLRGKGYPKSLERKPVHGKIQAMHEAIDEQVDAAKRQSAFKKWGSILLEPEQKPILITLVEAARNVPEDRREHFIAGETHDGPFLIHSGLVSQLRVFSGDIEALANERLLQVSKSGHDLIFDVTPKGFAYYRYLKQEIGTPTERVEGEIRQYVNAAQFRASYPEAYRKWMAAEDLLWDADSDQHLTTIGHYCREAMQEFAETLVKNHNCPDVRGRKTDTIARIKSVILVYSQKLGEKEKAFLDALVPYWGTISDIAQRQEHGAQKEGDPLIFEDARRIVFQTMVVMFEIDRALQRVSG